jgi:RNA polymerase sigma-B factor
MPSSVSGDHATERLLRRFARDQRPADLERLVRHFQPLARSLARRYLFTSVARDDLEQAAYLGLVKALRGFNPDRGCAFSTYAVPMILGEIRRQCRDAVWPAHVPRLVQERLRRVRQAADRLQTQHRRAPTAHEIAADLRCAEELVVESLTAAGALRSVSLDQERWGDDQDGSPVAAAVGKEDPGFDLVECRADIERAIPRLDDDERDVLRLRYEHERTFAEIGREFAVAPAQAARLARRSLAHLSALTGEPASRVAG